MAIPGPLAQMLSFILNDNVVYDAAAAASMTSAHVIPSGGAYLKINVYGGTNNSGTVTVSGNVGGVATNEILTFTAARWKITSNKWDAGAVVLTSSSLSNEDVVPTVEVTTTDVSGNPIYWVTTKNVAARFRDVKRFGINYLSVVQQAGVKSPWIFEAFVPGYPTWLKSGMSFTVRGLRETYAIDGQIVPHQQQGTDLVDFVHFFAVKKNDG